jgi:AcrR family transcriptional regulator
MPPANSHQGVAVSRRRRLAPDDRRAELIEAAIGVLRSGADEGNWVAEVTRAAGAAKGTFYVYFTSWEHMLAVVRERLIQESIAPIRDALAAGDEVDWWAVLEDQCGRFFDVVTEFGRHHALIFHSVLPGEPGGEARSGPTLLAAAIERGIAEGCFGPVDVEAAAQMLFAAVHTAADAVLAGGVRTRWISACTALARSYLAPLAIPIQRLRPSHEGTAPA